MKASSHAARMCAAFSVTALALISDSADAASLVANSKITAVTVYADRAVVTRTATVDLPAAGITSVVFDRLPASIVEESITVSGRGDAPVTILDLTGQETHVDYTPNERVKAVEDELQGWKTQRRVLEDRGNVLKAQEASLGKLETAATAAPTKDSAPRLSIEESGKLLGFLEEQRMKLAAERQSLDQQLEELGRKQKAAEQTLAELRGTRERSYVSITVRLEAVVAGKVELALGYALPGASWRPNYDVRASSADRGIALGYFGLVQQNTGEDWKEVALTLSTARPHLGGAAPQLATWVVDARQPMPVPMATGAISGVRMNAREERAKSAALADAIKLEAFSVQTAKADVEMGVTSASFKIAVPATVLSDNSPQKVPIAAARLEAVREYATVPKALPAAFLTAKATNSSEAPLIAGKMNVFLDGTFVATSALRTVMPGEKFDLELGADEGISVKHKRVNRFTENTGLTNSGKRITYEYLITIQNNKRTAERVVVSDQLPISRHEKIAVKQLAPAEKDVRPSSDGALKWTLDLKPGEKRELTVKFSVDYPNELPVSGVDA